MTYVTKIDGKAFSLEVARLSIERARNRKGWVMPRVLPADTLSLIAGKGGIGKTTAAIQLAALGAAGLDTEGNEIPPFATAIICREDTREEIELRGLLAVQSLPEERRAEALENLDIIGDLQDCDPQYFYTGRVIDGEPETVEINQTAPFEIGSPKLPDALIHVANERRDAGRAPLRLALLDPVKDLMPTGADGNAELAVREALKGIAKLNALGVSVLGITHTVKSTWQEGITNLAETIKGSGAWVDRARHVLIVGGSRETGSGAIFVAKSNMGADAGAFLAYTVAREAIEDLQGGRVCFGAWDTTDDLMQAFKDAEGVGKQQAKKERTAGKAHERAVALAAHMRKHEGKPLNIGQAADVLGIRSDKAEMFALRRVVEAGEGGALRLRKIKGRGNPSEFYLDPGIEGVRSDEQPQGMT